MRVKLFTLSGGLFGEQIIPATVFVYFYKVKFIFETFRSIHVVLDGADMSIEVTPQNTAVTAAVARRVRATS